MIKTLPLALGCLMLLACTVMPDGKQDSGAVEDWFASFIEPANTRAYLKTALSEENDLSR